MSQKHFSKMSYVALDEIFLDSFARCFLDLQILYILGI